MASPASSTGSGSPPRGAARSLPPPPAPPRQQPRLGLPLARRALLGPAARVRLTRRAETTPVDGRAALVLGFHHPRHDAAVALRPAARDVDDDPHHPRAQPRTALEAIEPPDDREPRLLNAFLGG